MKISLAFCLHDVENTIQDVLGSWLDRLSGKHDIEVICVFDDCHDNSAVVAREYMLAVYAYIPYKPFATANIWEIRCNNLALQHATGEVIIFAQGDNLQFTFDWDDALAQVMYRGSNAVGAVGLLAGVHMNKDFSLNRIECDRPHKGENFTMHGIAPDAYPLAVYRVDAINRPFATWTDNLRRWGGLDEAYCPMDWDDADYSLRCLSHNRENLYLPLDVVNTCAKKGTLSQGQIVSNYQHGEAIARERWSQFVAERESSFKMLMPLTEEDDGRLSL